MYSLLYTSSVENDILINYTITFDVAEIHTRTSVLKKNYIAAV